MKKILIGIISLGIVGAVIGLYMFNKPLANAKSMSSDFKIEASILLSAFENDENKANALYLDKVIEVIGNVQKVENKAENTTIYLDTGNPMSSIIVQLAEPDNSITKGELITLKGICTGYLMDVVLVRAVKI